MYADRSSDVGLFVISVPNAGHFRTRERVAEVMMIIERLRQHVCVVPVSQVTTYFECGDDLAKCCRPARWIEDVLSGPSGMFSLLRFCAELCGGVTLTYTLLASVTTTTSVPGVLDRCRGSRSYIDARLFACMRPFNLFHFCWLCAAHTCSASGTL